MTVNSVSIPSNKIALGQKPSGEPYKVLIVDDSIFVTKQLTQILTSEGFVVADTAVDGDQAVKKYQALKGKVDLVTMDITMPNKDGITALEELIAIDKDVKVIMISALGKQDLVRKALLSGAKNFIVKPLDRAKVLERITMSLK